MEGGLIRTTFAVQAIRTGRITTASPATGRHLPVRMKSQKIEVCMKDPREVRGEALFLTRATRLKAVPSRMATTIYA